MTPEPGTCDECDSRERWPYLGQLSGRRLCLCRRCVGVLVQGMLRFIRGFDRDHPRPKKPKDPALPIVDAFGQIRCRKCEGRIELYVAGGSPLCEGCREKP